MYLIISSEKTNNSLKSSLCQLDVDIVDISCVRLTPNFLAIDDLKQQINNFDIVIITSPTAIQYAHEVFKVVAKGITFIVPGISSYTKLRQYTQNEICYPKIGSGAEAMVNQVLDSTGLDGKKIAIIQGENANNTIEDYLAAKLGNNSYIKIVVYEQKWLDLGLSVVKKLLMDNSMQGIILTSSAHARYLFSQGQEYGFYDMLLKADFITLHIKIEQVIRKLGAKGHVFISDHASMESLIHLMGKLHDRCGR
jgi:uroporphyrinogen-III synthase